MRIKLVYPAQPFLLTEIPRPDGSLGLIYIAGALRQAGFEVSLLDMCVGDENDLPENAFHRRIPIDDEMIRAIHCEHDHAGGKKQPARFALDPIVHIIEEGIPHFLWRGLYLERHQATRGGS